MVCTSHEAWCGFTCFEFLRLFSCLCLVPHGFCVGCRYAMGDNPPPPPPRVSVPGRSYQPPAADSTGLPAGPAPLQPGSAPPGPSSFQGHVYNTSTTTPTVIIQAPPKIHNANENVTSSTSIATMDMSQPIEAVRSKLNWACAELDRCSSVGDSIQLCQLIKTCADALISLQTLNAHAHAPAQPGQSG